MDDLRIVNFMDNKITIRNCNKKMAKDTIKKQIRAPFCKPGLGNRAKLYKKKLHTFFWIDNFQTVSANGECIFGDTLWYMTSGQLRASIRT